MSLYSDHFLTLPSGHTITVPEGEEANDVFYAHAAASLAENICPWCLGPLSDGTARTDPPVDAPGVCFDSRHRPVRWHLCAEGLGYTLLDVPQNPASRCSVCGEPM